MIRFKAVIENRTEDGGFGPTKCNKCDRKSTAYLRLHLYNTYITLCRSCLNDAIDLVNKKSLENLTRKL